MVNGGPSRLPANRRYTVGPLHSYGLHREAWEFTDGPSRVGKLELRRAILEITSRERAQ